MEEWIEIDRGVDGGVDEGGWRGGWKCGWGLSFLMMLQFDIKT